MVSVIIVNYNTFSLTCDCIQSIHEMEPRLETEIIVVDNASTDKPAGLFKEKFPNIILIQSPTNLGFAKANNLGIQKASGEIILLLNSDVILANKAISIAGEFLVKHDQVAVVTARMVFPDGRVQHNCQRFPSIRYSLFELLRLQKLIPWKKKILFGSFFNYDEIAYPDWVWGTFFMFRKRLLQKFKDSRLPDDFFLYVEDMQWCMEIRMMGYKIAFLPDAQVIHFMGASGGNKNKMIDENFTTFMRQYYSSWRRSIILFLNKLLA